MPFLTLLTPVKRNILVDDSGRVRIADFGFTVTQNLDSVGNTKAAHGFTLSWTAPEILKEGVVSQKADIFSFAMVMIEVRHDRSTISTTLAQCHSTPFQVYTGANPFGDSSTRDVMESILRGRHPERPTHPTFTEDLWSLVQRCWNHAEGLLPPASEVLGTLEVLACRRLASSTLTKPERIFLINAIFSDHNWSKVIDHVYNDFAQDFLDTVNEVSPHKQFRV
jgi:serine/threonine protein kinase